MGLTPGIAAGKRSADGPWLLSQEDFMPFIDPAMLAGHDARLLR
jgi:hypothetical protein